MDDTLSLGTDFATWAIKDFSVVLRQQITQGARRQDCTVAEWLHSYFQQHGIDGQQFTVVQIARVQPEAAAPVDDLCRLTEAAARLAETGDRMPKGLRAQLSRGLREAARARLPQPASRPRLKAITHAPDVEAA